MSKPSLVPPPQGSVKILAQAVTELAVHSIEPEVHLSTEVFPPAGVPGCDTLSRGDL